MLSCPNTGGFGSQIRHFGDAIGTKHNEASKASKAECDRKTMMKVFFFYDSKFVPLRDYMVASMEACGASSAFELKEDILDDLGGNNRILVAIPSSSISMCSKTICLYQVRAQSRSIQSFRCTGFLEHVSIILPDIRDPLPEVQEEVCQPICTNLLKSGRPSTRLTKMRFSCLQMWMFNISSRFIRS